MAGRGSGFTTGLANGGTAKDTTRREPVLTRRPRSLICACARRIAPWRRRRGATPRRGRNPRKAPSRNPPASAVMGAGRSRPAHPARLLGAGAVPVGRRCRHRRRGLDRRASAPDPESGNPQTATVDQNSWHRRSCVVDARRSGFSRRAALRHAALSAQGDRRHRGPALLFAFRHRPVRHCARGDRANPASRRFAGRLDAHAATREEPVPDAGAHASSARCRKRCSPLWLEHKFTKEQILELYLNRVYFGSGAYGVEAASQRYFGKSARRVTLAEAAMLAGLVKAPSRLSPLRDPKLAREARAQLVARRHGETSITSPRPMAQAAIAASRHAVDDGRQRLGELRRRLDHGRDRRPDRPRRAGHRRQDHDRSDNTEPGRGVAGR